MKESELYLPVREWLRARGYVVHIEVFDADVVGIRPDGHLCVVELKRGMTRDLFNQCVHRVCWADEVWAAVPSTAEKPPSGWAYHGFGLLIVNGARVREQRAARPQPWAWHRTRNYRRKVLLSRLPAADHHVAGLPSCAQAKKQRDEVRQRIAQVRTA